MIDLIDALKEYSKREDSNKTAIKFITDSGLDILSYKNLEEETRRLAVYLSNNILPKERVLIALDPGLNYVIAFLGCLYANVIAIPVYPSKNNHHRKRLDAIVDDSTASLVLINRKDKERSNFKIPTQCIEDILSNKLENYHPSKRNINDIAYFQYTSGSTGHPKGVMVSHNNIINNLSFMRRRFFREEDEIISCDWIPPHHDMGLIGSILLPLYYFGTAVLMFPNHFIQKPIRWLKAISDEKANISFAPDFAYKICVDLIKSSEVEQLNLSLWKNAINASEPVMYKTLREFYQKFKNTGFKKSFFNPAWGMSETTLITTIKKYSSDTKILNLDKKCYENNIIKSHEDTELGKVIMTISCGVPVDEHEIVIVNPRSKKICAPNTVGEIWINGPCVATGYWNKPRLTHKTFHAHIKGVKESKSYLRTGDLGFLDKEGNIYITGRLKDMLIINGRNIYPQDIETIVENSHKAIMAHATAAVSGEHDRDLIIIAEIHRHEKNFLEVYEEIIKNLAVSDALYPSRIALIRQSSLPRTSSGKRQRNKAKDQLYKNELRIVNEWNSKSEIFDGSINDLEKKLACIWNENFKNNQIGVNDNFLSIGCDSHKIIQFTYLINKELKLELTEVDLFVYPTIKKLVSYINDVKEKRNKIYFKNEIKNSERIAVIGYSCIFPGSKDENEFWNNIDNGNNCIDVIEKKRCLKLGVHREIVANKNYIPAGWVLDDIRNFDANFWNLSPKDASLLNPQTRVMLELSWKALEKSGYINYTDRSLVGTFFGVGKSDYFYNCLSNYNILKEAKDQFEIEIHADKDFLATHINYLLGLEGPALNINTACSSSLVAIIEACEKLLNNQCNLALAGGISLNLPNKFGYIYRKGMLFSKSGSNNAFSDNADGTIFTGGAGVVVLKRLSDAIDDNDNIISVIDGYCINNDGNRKVGYTAPSLQGQKECILSAQKMAGITSNEVNYVECHGTATDLGDTVEIKALNEAFIENSSENRSSKCIIGSVKSNIGHAVHASGVAGFIKVCQMFDNDSIPLQINCKKINPKFEIRNTQFSIPKRKTVWKGNKKNRRIAGVSSFGIGGTNAHLILSEPPKRTIKTRENKHSYELLTFSAKSRESLKQNIKNFSRFLSNNKNLVLNDIAYTLSVTKKEFNHRKFFVCSTIKDAFDQTLNVDDSKTASSESLLKKSIKPTVVFLCSGVGEHYVNMAKGLYEEINYFKSEFDKCSIIANQYLEKDLRDIVFNRIKDSDILINNTSYLHAAVFTCGYAASKLWIKLGVVPDFLIGHSIGEYLAACISGVFSLEDALYLIINRANLLSSITKGAMTAVPLKESELKKYITTGISIAAVNGPSLCVVSGNTNHITEFEKKLFQEGIASSRLPVFQAFHSKMMATKKEELFKLFSSVKYNNPQIPYISNLTGKFIEQNDLNANYWYHHTCGTVQFSKGILRLLSGNNVFLEVGTGRNLASSVLQHQTKEIKLKGMVLDSIRNSSIKEDDYKYFLNSLGKLWLQGVNVEWKNFYDSDQSFLTKLPTYSFDKKNYWIKSESNFDSPDIIEKRTFKRQDIKDWLYIPIWKRDVKTAKIKDADVRNFNYLVFQTKDSLVHNFVNSIKNVNALTFTVSIADEYKYDNEKHSFCINPYNREDYSKLFTELAKLNVKIDNITHFWCFDIDDSTNKDHVVNAKSIDKYQNIGINSLLYIVKEISNHQPQYNVNFSIITSGAQNVIGGDLIYPEKTIVQGLIKTANLELPFIKFKNLDLPIVTDAFYKSFVDIEQILISEISLIEKTEQNVAYRGKYRWREDIQKTTLNKRIPENNKLKSNGIYLITGGLGGVGLIIAKYLSSKYNARIILTGRSSFPKKEVWNKYKTTNNNEFTDLIGKLEKIEKSGGTVDFFQCDISDLNNTKQLLEFITKNYGNLNGIFHCAGILSNKFILDTDTGYIKEIFAPKVIGTTNLNKTFVSNKLDLFVMFSSLVTTIGGIGQMAYAAANSYLDATVHCDNKAKTSYYSINLDFLDNIGMSQNADISSTFSELAIKQSEMITLVDSIISSDIDQAIISTIDLNKRISYFNKTEIKPKDVIHDENSKSIHLRPELVSDYIPPGNDIEKAITQIWSKVFGIDCIGLKDNFFELGGNSINAIQVSNQMSNVLGFDITLRHIFKYKTIDKILKNSSSAKDEDEYIDIEV